VGAFPWSGQDNLLGSSISSLDPLSVLPISINHRQTFSRNATISLGSLSPGSWARIDWHT
jgi:hypothetical protein